MAEYFKSRKLPAILLAIVAGSIAGLIAAGATLPLMLLGALGALGALYLASLRTELAAAALVFMIYINLSDVLIKHHGFPSVAKFYIPLMVLLLGLEWLRHGHRPWLPATGLLVLTAYSTVLSLSFFYAVDHELVTASFVVFAKNLTIALVMALLVSSPVKLRIVLWSILAGALLLSMLSVFKYLTGDFVNNFGGFAQAESAFWHQDQWSHRMTGVIGDPNYFAQIILISVPISFERMLSETKRFLKYAAGCALLLGILTIVLTFSRGGLVALAIISPIALFKLRANPKTLIIGVLLVIAALPLLPSGYMNRITSAAPAIALGVDEPQQPDGAVEGRLAKMSVTWNIFLDHPFFGVGLGNQELNYHQYALRRDLNLGGSSSGAHSLYLEMAAEGGVIGLLSFALLLFYLGRVSLHGWRTLKQAGFSCHADMIAGLAVAFLAYLLTSIFLHDAYPRYFWMLVGLLLAVPGVVRNTLPRDDS